MIVDEQLGDGVMSAEDFFMRLDTVKGSRGEDRVVILLDGRFVPIAEQIHAESVADAESIRSASAVPEVEAAEAPCVAEGDSVATERRDSTNGGGGAASPAAAQARRGDATIPPSSVVTRGIDVADVADGAAARPTTEPGRPSPRSSRGRSSSRSSATSTAHSLTMSAGHGPLRSLTVSSRERSSRGTGPRSGRVAAAAASAAAAAAAAAPRRGPPKGTPTQPPVEAVPPPSLGTSPQTVPPPAGDADGYRSAAPSTVPSVPPSSRYGAAGHGPLSTAGASVTPQQPSPVVTRDFQAATAAGGEDAASPADRPREHLVRTPSADLGRVSSSGRSSRRSSRHSGAGADGSSRASGERERAGRRSGGTTPRQSRRSSTHSRGTSGAGAEGATAAAATAPLGAGEGDAVPSPVGGGSRQVSRHSSHRSSHPGGTEPSDGGSRHLSRRSSRRRSSGSHLFSEEGPQLDAVSHPSTGAGDTAALGAEGVGLEASPRGVRALDRHGSRTHSQGSSAGARLSARLSSEEISMREQESQSQERAIAWAAQQRASLDRQQLSAEVPDDPDADIRREQAEARRRHDAELRERQEALFRRQPYQPTYAPPHPQADGPPQPYYQGQDDAAAAWAAREGPSRGAPVPSYPEQSRRSWPAARDNEGPATVPQRGYVAARGASEPAAYDDGRHYGATGPPQAYGEGSRGAAGPAAYDFGGRSVVAPSRTYGDGGHGAPSRPTYHDGRVTAGPDVLRPVSPAQRTHEGEMARTQAAWQERLLAYYQRQQQEYEHLEATQQQVLAQQLAEEQAWQLAEEDAPVATSPPPSLQSSVGVYAREPPVPPGSGILPASVTTRSMEMGSGTSPFPSASTTTGSRPAGVSASTSGPSDARPSIEPEETLTGTATASIPTVPHGPLLDREGSESSVSGSTSHAERGSGDDVFVPAAPIVPGELTPSVPDSGPVVRIDSSLADGSSYGPPESSTLSLPGVPPGLERRLSAGSGGDASGVAAMDVERQRTSPRSPLSPAPARADDEPPTPPRVAEDSEVLLPTPTQTMPQPDLPSPSPPPRSSGDTGSFRGQSPRTSEQDISPSPVATAETAGVVRDMGVAGGEVGPSATIPSESAEPAVVPSLLSRLKDGILGSDDEADHSSGAAQAAGGESGAVSPPAEGSDDASRPVISGGPDVPGGTDPLRDEDQAAGAGEQVMPAATTASSSLPPEAAAATETKPPADGLLGLFRGTDAGRDDRSGSSRGSGDGGSAGERRAGLLGLFRRKGPDSEEGGSSTAARAADGAKVLTGADKGGGAVQPTEAEQEGSEKARGVVGAAPVPAPAPGAAPGSQETERPADHPTGSGLLGLFRRDDDEGDLSSLEAGAPDASSSASSGGKPAKTGGLLGLLRLDRPAEAEGSPTVTPPASTGDAGRVSPPTAASPPRRGMPGPAEGGPTATLPALVDDTVPVPPPTLASPSRRGKPGDAATPPTASDDAMPVLPPTSASHSRRELPGAEGGSLTATPSVSADDAVPVPSPAFASPAHRSMPVEAERSLTETPPAPTGDVVPVQPPAVASLLDDASPAPPPLSREALEEHQRAQAAGRIVDRSLVLPTSAVTRGAEAAVTPSDSQSYGSRVARAAVDEPPLASAQEASPAAAPVADPAVDGSAGAMGSSDTAPYLSRNESAYTVHSALSALSSSTADGVTSPASEQDTPAPVAAEVTRGAAFTGEVTLAEAPAAGPERAAEQPLAQGRAGSTAGEASSAGDSRGVGLWLVPSQDDRPAVRDDSGAGGDEPRSDEHPPADNDAPWPSPGPTMVAGGAATRGVGASPRSSTSSTGSTETDTSGEEGSSAPRPGAADDADSGGGFLSHLKERVLGRRPLLLWAQPWRCPRGRPGWRRPSPAPRRRGASRRRASRPSAPSTRATRSGRPTCRPPTRP